MLRSMLKKSSNFLYNIPSFNKLAISANISNQVQPKLDDLYKSVLVEVRGHDQAVLNSYEWFAKTSANELGLKIAKIWEPPVHKKRRTLLKSVFIYKKHRVQYEMRTYFRLFEFKHLTGSTADTYLEYIQRNLPEGVSMKVIKHRIEKLPDHIANHVTEKKTEDSQSKK
ncbi:small ribosomal subunit protein uS10m [Parasteatoda tepidariorum]|uniref:small ribosomal subunit protein uS10m n=1 Tax=Parasteatoda tepidariorum TaxID=114398 RepID=UPI00077FA832|nr:28S ribosomal protein S10, mitochondrial [Parasteatoda tepidariorum]